MIDCRIIPAPLPESLSALEVRGDPARLAAPLRVVIDKDGEVCPGDAASLVTTFRREWNDYTSYRLFYCRGCRQTFTANVDEETVHDCPPSN